jgi:hypothetical protein
MGNRIQLLAQQLLGKSSVAECSIDELKHLVHRHPYFAPAQFLLFQKLKETGSPEIEAQSRKSILYYHDPLQFEYFMSSDIFSADSDLSKLNEEASEDHSESINVENPVDPEFENDKAFDEPLVDEPLLNTDPQITGEEAATKSIFNKDFIEPSLHKNEEPMIPANQNELPELVQASSDNGEKQTPEPESLTSELSFEPYHMVDYFASQGIKFSSEELAKDKLGRQLKSFTDWLKTMKRLPSPEPPFASESAAEKNIETMANSSVTNSDIITEAMAEVWAKQGAREKAIEIYNKLSLLYPSKKAFFAGKIENLNRS